MAIVLQNNTFATKLQVDTQQLLASWLYINNSTTFPPPVTMPDIKTALENGQPGTFTDDEFKAYIQRLYDLPIEDASLTAAERTIKNEMRIFLEVPPSLACCGSDTDLEPICTTEYFQKIGAAGFDYEFRLVFENTATCAIFEVEVTWTPSGGAPTLSMNPVTLYPLGCIDNSWVFSKLWVRFAADPTGFNYDITCVAKDVDGNTIDTFNKNVSF